jgi:collagen type I alpha
MGCIQSIHGATMYGPRHPKLLVLALSALAVLLPVGAAGAACPLRPPPPCGPVAFTGGLKAHSSQCIRKPTTICRDFDGRRGPRGLRGLTGKTGPTGSSGATGSQGLQGVQGIAGVPGSDGADGVDGINGTAGAPGTDGVDGVDGINGTAGIDGTDGTQGPAGPARVTEYAYVYNVVARSVATEADVIFDSNGVMTSGITHAVGTAGVALLTAGDYKVTFSVSGTSVSQMALFVNGSVVSGAIYGSGAGTQQNTGQAIVRIGAGDLLPGGAVLTVRNHTTTAAVDLASFIGGTQANANASVLVEKLN